MAGGEKPGLDALLADLADERADLRAVIEPLDLGGWTTVTPAKPWTIRDQVAHLGYFDRAATLAATEPSAFDAEVRTAVADFPAYERHTLAVGPVGPDVLDWWNEQAADFDRAYAGLDGSVRVPWYGPPMAARSMVSARIMEVWAHGQDVYDALGRNRVATDRLRHVCRIAARARGYAYTVRGMPVPPEPVGVRLRLPSGGVFEHEPDAKQSITGTAEEFCLVMTQRRHHADTGLVPDGPLAEEWLRIGQAYAGPAGEGRAPRGGDAS